MQLPDQVAEDFLTYVNDATGSMILALSGLRMAREQRAKEYDEAILKDERIVFGVHDDATGRAVPVQVSRLDQLDERLRPDGHIARFIGRQWITSVFEHWEQVARQRAATELNIPKDDVSLDIMGDLRHLRHDVVHHDGIATEDNAGKCQIVGHWVVVGQPILFTPAGAREFIDLFCREAGCTGLLDPQVLEAAWREERRRFRAALDGRVDS